MPVSSRLLRRGKTGADHRAHPAIVSSARRKSSVSQKLTEERRASIASSAVASFASGWSTMAVIPSWWHRSASSRRARRLSRASPRPG
ncbi:MAG: hypothetical protein ACLUEQ_03760 [Cloacibacillus evryensis]